MEFDEIGQRGQNALKNIKTYDHIITKPQIQSANLLVSHICSPGLIRQKIACLKIPAQSIHLGEVTEKKDSQFFGILPASSLVRKCTLPRKLRS